MSSDCSSKREFIKGKKEEVASERESSYQMLVGGIEEELNSFWNTRRRPWKKEDEPVTWLSSRWPVFHL